MEHVHATFRKAAGYTGVSCGVFWPDKKIDLVLPVSVYQHCDGSIVHIVEPAAA